MITDTTKKVLVALSIISLFTTILGNLSPNILFNFDKESILFNENYTWEERLLAHDPYGVCGIGLITGALLSLLLIVQISFLNNLDNKNREGRRILGIFTFIIILLYFVLQLIANSYPSHRLRNWAEPKIGLWEFMLPTYVCQFIILCILFSEKDEL